MSKYGKPIWQYVLEAAKSLEIKTFSPIDIIRKVHEINAQIPDVTIRSYVLAMAPNHHSSKHYPSTRKLHGYFWYLGNGRFQLKETPLQTEGEEIPEEAVTIEEDLEEAAISLERDLEAARAKSYACIYDPKLTARAECTDRVMSPLYQKKAKY
jgi:hypothetical protein